MAYSLPASRILFDDAKSPRELSERRDELVAEMTKATAAGLVGETTWGPQDQYTPIPAVIHNPSKSGEVRKALDELGTMAKGAYTGGTGEVFSKEWSLTNPVATGLVPYDLEAPAKLLTPRPTPFRNSIPRLKGQGSARRFKVISGFTGTGTGGITTTQPGITETSTNAGPGGLSYIRGPYISYAGYDVTLNYVTTSLSDSVSWQAEYQGQGFEDIRSLSNTALLYATHSGSAV